jgi:hypothetical protein
MPAVGMKRLARSTTWRMKSRRESERKMRPRKV